ncbi:hypothetical protein EUX98_g6994 [Antrodiella citrinella]|uniref:Uncharacterized protein n=1 Tax=Antrodiella citrinella TaxID=2447956 RepID=A0A4V3XHY6_9APHY|nr:hypothetical protein EUX98_g6994 [Antrodiella citrinella]
MATESLAIAEFLNYPFDSDETYQQGLAGIIAGGALEGKTDVERSDVLQRSRLFYYNRLKGSTLTPEDVKLYQTTSGNAALAPQAEEPSTTQAPEEPRTLTFAELKELIESGRTDQIPNNRHIPNDLHPAAPTARWGE